MSRKKMFILIAALFSLLTATAYAQTGYLSGMFKYVGPEKNYQAPVPKVAPQPSTQDVSPQTIPMPRTVHGQNILKTSFSMIGIPYVYGGMSKSGMDCSGFVGIVYNQACNLKLPRTAHDIYLKSKKFETTASLEPGDLVFFSASGKRISHVGIYLGENLFIHAASDGPKTGVIVSKLAERYWKRTFVGGGKVL